MKKFLKSPLSFLDRQVARVIPDDFKRILSYGAVAFFGLQGLILKAHYDRDKAHNDKVIPFLINQKPNASKQQLKEQLEHYQWEVIPGYAPMSKDTKALVNEVINSRDSHGS